MINKKEFRIALAKLDMPAIRLAAHIGVHHSVLYTWINGHCKVPSKYKEKLCGMLQVSHDTLFDNNSRKHGGQ